MTGSAYGSKAMTAGSHRARRGPPAPPATDTPHAPGRPCCGRPAQPTGPDPEFDPGCHDQHSLPFRAPPRAGPRCGRRGRRGRPARPRPPRGPARLAAAAAALLVCAIASTASAQQSFKTPDEAVTALVSAAKAGDRQAVLTVLGPSAQDIVSSGDEVADEGVRKEFVAAYDEKHEVYPDGGHAILFVGKDDFPFPIPLVRKGDTWSFDTEAGRQEVLFRRIGGNELDTIQSALAYEIGRAHV